ncbi:MAG: rRNA maturation RNase YbeY [Candidatus Omnitrophica bacterium]|nr:rRNA maturation RNase YbeY [Candidatus Omnitrophota bacterium]
MKITIKNLQKKIPIHPIRIKKAILKVLESEGKHLSGNISVCFVNNKKIKELNSRFHARPEVTDVLAFDLRNALDKGKLFADIAISTDKAKENAEIFDTSNQQKLDLYAVHGVLHLLGYNDSTPKKKARMREKECQFIKLKQ